MLLLEVHRLGETDIGSNGRTEEVEGPECWYDAAVELARGGCSV